MKLVALLVLLLSLFTQELRAAELVAVPRFGYGANFGWNFPAPWAKSSFREANDPNFGGGVWFRGQWDPLVSSEVAYDHLRFTKSNYRGHLFTFGLYRNFVLSERTFLSVGLGLGLAAMENYFGLNAANRFGAKLRVGMEWSRGSGWLLGLYLNHYTVFRNRTGETSSHVLTPSLGATYLFGQ